MATAPEKRDNGISTSGIRNCDIARHVLAMLSLQQRKEPTEPRKVKETCPNKTGLVSKDLSGNNPVSSKEAVASKESAIFNNGVSGANPELRIQQSKANSFNEPVEVKTEKSHYHIVDVQDGSESIESPSPPQRYRKGQVLKCMDRDNYEFWVVPNIQTIHLDTLVQTICGMLNTHCNGSIYFGVDATGTVVGTPVSRNARDEVRVTIDSCVCHRIIPNLITPTIDVRFVPVDTPNSNSNGCKNLFVAEIHLFPSPFDFYALSSGQSYVWKRRKNIKLSSHDVFRLAIAHGVKLFGTKSRSGMIK